MAEKIPAKTIPEMVRDTAERLPDRHALILNNGDGTLSTISYSRLWERIVRLSSFIQKKGFERGAHIALLGGNSPEWATTYLAIQSAGCIVVPLDSLLKPQELRHILRHSDSIAIFANEKFLSPIFECGEDETIAIQRFSLENIEEYIAEESADAPLRLPAPEDIAAIIYTSGTTGSPKGAILTHRNIISDINSVIPLFDFTSNDTFLSVLPLHHVFECTCGFLTAMSIGCGICYARAIRAKEILEDIQASGATILLGVPLLFEKFYNGILKGIKRKGLVAESLFNSAMGITKTIDKSFKAHSGKTLMKAFRKKAGFGNLWLMISGGAAINPDIINFFNHFGVICAQGYGLTETSPVLTVNPMKKNIPASVGPPLSCVEIRIFEKDSEGIGEIQAKGEPIFQGYYKNPEATKSAFTEDGWFKTGDLGSMDENGYVYIAGRAKNVIVTSAGKNIYPEEIEEKLNESEFVMESLVIGVCGNAGEEPFAIIVPDFDAIDAHFGGNWKDSDLENLLRQVVEKTNSTIASYKRIKGFKIQHEEFPKTSTKKIKRYLFTGKEIKL